MRIPLFLKSLCVQMGVRAPDFLVSVFSCFVCNSIKSSIIWAHFVAIALPFCQGHLRFCRIMCEFANCNWVIRLPYWSNPKTQHLPTSLSTLLPSPSPSEHVVWQLKSSPHHTRPSEQCISINPQRARGCMHVHVHACAFRNNTHTSFFTHMAARICLSKHSPLSGSEVGPMGALSPESLAIQNRLHCAFCAEGDLSLQTNQSAGRWWGWKVWKRPDRLAWKQTGMPIGKDVCSETVSDLGKYWHGGEISDKIS